MKKIFSLLASLFLFFFHSFSQTEPLYQPLENQRLSTTNTPLFTNLGIQDPSYPQIGFTTGNTGITRLLFTSGSNLVFRYNGTSDGIILHSANFNSYAPTLTGTGATGYWNISTSGLRSYLGPNDVFWGWNSAGKLTAKVDATEFAAGAPMDISGNAASATYWGGYDANFAGYGTDLQWITGYNSTTGKIGAYNAAQMKSFLGIPSDGETLQSVTDRGSSTNSTILSSAIEGLRMTANSAYISGFNTEGTERNGFLQFNAGLTTLQSEVGGKVIALNPVGGNVGIGTSAPSNEQGWNRVFELHGTENAKALVTTNLIKGGIFVHDSWSGRPPCLRIGTETQHPVVFMAGYGQDAMYINVDGKIGIGTSQPQSELAVKGTITSKKIKVTQDSWADYVFDSAYQLSSLDQVEKYIRANKRLPDVPSAAEVKKDGLDLGDNQAILLKKIEELTLYIIRQNKEMMQQHNEMQEMKKMIKELQASKQ